MKRFLIIEDDPGEAEVLERRLNSACHCECVKAIGPNSELLRAVVREKVETLGPFDGTILDIIYTGGERQGGITLWRNLVPEIRDRCGVLAVVTKDAPAKPLTDFVAEFAPGRLIQSYVEERMVSQFRQIFCTGNDGDKTTQELEMLRAAVRDLAERVARVEDVLASRK